MEGPGGQPPIPQKLLLFDMTTRWIESHKILELLFLHLAVVNLKTEIAHFELFFSNF